MATEVDVRALAALLPFPEADANKYTRGKLVLVAGSDRYPGAAALAARAAQRMGAGYVEVITTPEAVDVVRNFAPSLVVVPRANWRVSSLCAPQPGKPQAVCMGPGFAAGDRATAELVCDVLDSYEGCVVVDGGGLSALESGRAKAVLGRRAARGLSCVVTPHGGEAARLAHAFGIDESDPEQLARALAQALGAVVVLKGPDTYVAESASAGQFAHPRVVAVRNGSAALAKAGTGDVLAGMVGALCAQGLEAFDAACLGAYLHAEAGNAAAEFFGLVGTCPEDVVESIPQAVEAVCARG